MKYFFRLVIASIALVLLYLTFSDHYPKQLEKWGVPTQSELISGIKEMKQYTVEMDPNYVTVRFEVRNDSLFDNGEIVHGSTKLGVDKHSNSTKMLDLVIRTESHDGTTILDTKVVNVNNDWVVSDKGDTVKVYTAIINKIDSTSIDNQFIQLHFTDLVEEPYLKLEKIGIYPILPTDSEVGSYRFSDSTWYKRSKRPTYVADRWGL